MLVLVLLNGCKLRERNVMFAMPYELHDAQPAIVHYNRDSVRFPDKYEQKIEIQDYISIRFLNNFTLESSATIAGSGGSTQGLTFLVDDDGNITVPMLGKVKVVDLTRQQASAYLGELYQQSGFKKPTVDVSIMNLSVTVLGEVTRPGVVPLVRDRTTLPEILSASGGITQFGKVYNVRLIRGVGTGDGKPPEVIVFDMTRLDVIPSEEMIVRDKDILYVEPKGIRIIANAILPYTGFLSVVNTLTTFYVLVDRVVSPNP